MGLLRVFNETKVVQKVIGSGIATDGLVHPELPCAWAMKPALFFITDSQSKADRDGEEPMTMPTTVGK